METQDHVETLQVLSFVLDGDFFAIGIDSIQEVIEYKNVTRVPRSPEFMQGVINLRGQVIPVVDLRVLFSMHVSEVTLDTCIIIIDVDVDGEENPIGIVADSVKEVVEFNVSKIQAAPKIGLSVDNRFIYGMVEQEHNLLILLSIQQVFNADDIQQLLVPVEDTVAVEEADA
ncbi:chemotaxis protein CheW [Alteromonas gracilis]|uniref:chemotaxis protein CheW n=1 Tax=Alteromonas gracilis TaxID=1479524 RepID=UPI003735DAC9